MLSLLITFLIPCIITHYVSHFGLRTVAHNRQLIFYISRLYYISLRCVSIILRSTIAMFFFNFIFILNFIYNFIFNFFISLSFNSLNIIRITITITIAITIQIIYAFVLYLPSKDSGSRAEQFAIWSGALASRSLEGLIPPGLVTRILLIVWVLPFRFCCRN